MSNEYLARLQRELRAVTTVQASEAKNQFGQVLETALTSGPVVITKHDAPKAILMSITEFEAMTRTRDQLDTLTRRFDATYAKLQRPEARRAMAAAFDASVTQLGQAAVKQAAKQARKKR